MIQSKGIVDRKKEGVALHIMQSMQFFQIVEDDLFECKLQRLSNVDQHNTKIVFHPSSSLSCISSPPFTTAFRSLMSKEIRIQLSLMFSASPEADLKPDFVVKILSLSQEMIDTGCHVICYNVSEIFSIFMENNILAQTHYDL